MVQRDDGCGLGEPVALDNGESHLAPERLEVGLERRRADHEGPELPAEDPMHVAVVPPAAECAGETCLVGRPVEGACLRVVVGQRLRIPAGPRDRTTYSFNTSRIFGTDTSTDTRRDLICAAMSAGL